MKKLYLNYLHWKSKRIRRRITLIVGESWWVNDKTNKRYYGEDAEPFLKASGLM